MKTLIIIPARYASTRYRGKPLVPLRGAGGDAKTLIRRSWDAAMAAGVDRVVVATDDVRIQSHAQDFGAEVVMTPASCRNGTERCAAAYDALGCGYDIVINLQGDAPLTPAWFIADLVAGLAADPDALVATPVLPTNGAMLNGLLADRRAGRVGGTTAVFSANHHALYFTKEVIPHTAQTFGDDDATPVYHHVGVYAYRPAALSAYVQWAPSDLEQLEGLEQLRFLDNRVPVLCVKVDAKGQPFWELNNPQDVPVIEGMMQQIGMA